MTEFSEKVAKIVHYGEHYSLISLKKKPFMLGGLKFFGGSICHVFDSVTYEPLSIYNVLANKTFATTSNESSQ